MYSPFRTSLRPVALAAVALAVLAGAARGQESTAESEPASTVEGQASIPVASDERIPLAELSDAQVALFTAAAAELMAILPHEPGGQPGSAIDGLVIMGSVIDSIGGRGGLLLTDAEGNAIVAGLEARGIAARYCPGDCPGRYGDAALNFHLPRITDDETTVWIITRWALTQLPGQSPDRIVQRGDQFRARRSEGTWRLADHVILREGVRDLSAPPLREARS